MLLITIPSQGHTSKSSLRREQTQIHLCLAILCNDYLINHCSFKFMVISLVVYWYKSLKYGTLQVVFFGDNVPKARADAAMEAAKGCDAFLVLGSSLMTMSAFRLIK